MIAIAGVGVALSVKDALEKHKIGGRIILLGTPGPYHIISWYRINLISLSRTAEEGGGGKAVLLEKGAYKDMDVCVM